MAFPLLLLLAVGACSRAPRGQARAGAAVDTAVAAIARDRPEGKLAPLAGAFTLERVAVERAHLGPVPPAPVEVTPAEPSLAPPPAEPDEPPAPEPGAGTTERELQPPIPRGLPASAAAGRGGRVTLDVRVDEQGDVSDALWVESDADSLVVRAAIDLATSVRYHPALLGGRPVAVWTRQVVQVRPARH